MRIKIDGKRVSLKDDLHDAIWDAFDEYMETHRESKEILNQFFDSKDCDKLATELASIVESHLEIVTH